MKTSKQFVPLLAWLIIALIALSCGPASPAPEPTQPPTSPPDTPETVGRCGDGICDEAEQENPALCPQDCGALTSASEALSSGSEAPTAPAQPPLPTETAPASEPTGQPNIVVILTDDQEPETMQYMPMLNALLIDQGTTFTNFLVSMPLCCPSRATFLRAQYGHNTEIMGNDLPYGGFRKFAALNEEDSTVATWLQDAGYRTMLAGKYLNAFPDANDLMHLPKGWTEWYSPVDGDAYVQYNYVLNENGQQVEYGEEPDDYGTDVYAGKTIEFIERSVAEEKPFFAYVSVYAPHWPYTAAPRHEHLFPDATAPRSPNFDEEDVSDKPAHIRKLPPLSDDEIERIDDEYRRRLRALMGVDELIESVVDTLESTGQLDNTYIFYTSDNGFHLGCHRQVAGKTAPYDEDTRVTMIVRGPGVPKGVTLDHLTGNIDAGPTWAALAGVQAPDFVDGRSLTPLMRDDPPPLSEWRQSFLLEHAPFDKPTVTFVSSMPRSNTPPGVLEPPDADDEVIAYAPDGQEETRVEVPPYRGMRTYDYLYVEYPTGDRELYDLQSDPYQLDNLIATADPDLVSELAARLEELAACSGSECQAIEDKPFGEAPRTAQAPATTPETTPAPPAGAAQEPLIYYLGYATPEDMPWIESFDVDVLTRGFLLFLNTSDAWLEEYGAQMEQCQQEGREFLVGLQAAVLVEDARDLPSLGPDDPALSIPMEAIPEWDEFACRNPEGLTLDDATGGSFAHSCLNDEGFRAFLTGKIYDLIDGGADGVHIDEWLTRAFSYQEGFCEDCLRGFRTYLSSKYSAAELQSVYQITDVGSFDFRQRLAEEGNLETPPASPLHREWWLYQLTSLAEAEQEMASSARSYAAQRGVDFAINSNAYEPEWLAERLLEMPVTDFSAIGTGMTIRLRRGGAFMTELRIPPSYSYIPLYRLAQAVTPEKPVTLFIDGPWGTNTMKGLSEQEQRDVVRWLFAEAYATGARFHVPYPSLDYYAPLDTCESSVSFIQANRGIYETAEPLAEVGVLFSYASEIWDAWVQADSAQPIHNRQYYGLAQALTDAGVQYQVLFAPDGNVIPDSLSLEDLLAFDTLIVPGAYSMNDQQLELLEDYAGAGGRLIVAGHVGTFDEEKVPRSEDVAGRLESLGATVLAGLDFEAYLANPADERAAAIREWATGLFPGRMVTVSSDRVTALLSSSGNTLYCHLINKERGTTGFTPQTSICVQITLPAGFDPQGDQAVFLSPDLPEGTSVPLPMQVQDTRVQITIPELAVYGIVVIER